MQNINSKKHGFTLLEILIVISIIAILSGIIIVAVNPSKQFAQANNAERKVEIKKMLDAITQYSVDNSGYMNNLLPAGYNLGDKADIVAGPSTGPGEIDLSVLVPTYLIPDVPHDASLPNDAHDTGYDFILDNNQIIIISAPLVELGASLLSLEMRGS